MVCVKVAVLSHSLDLALDKSTDKLMDTQW